MVKSVREFMKRILIITMIMITLIFFAIEPYAKAVELPAEGEFYYAGTTTGVFVAKEGIFAWLARCLGDIIDWILGFITMGFRMAFVGWATIFEWLLTRTLESTTGLTFLNDAMSATNMTNTNDSSNNVTVESIVYNNVPLFNINFFDFTIDQSRTGTGRDLTQLVCKECQKNYGECDCSACKDNCTECKTKLAMENMVANASQQNVIIMIKETIAEWFYIMRIIALAAMLCVLIAIGIKIAISTLSSEKALYKRMLVDWLVGIIFLFGIEYIMLFIININEITVDLVEEYAKSDSSIATQITKKEFGEAAKTNEDLEISVYEAVRSRAYDIKLINGITGMVMYITLVVFAWRFSWMYLKRYFTLIVLTLMGPGVAFSYAMQKVFTGKSKSWSNWLQEYIVNVFIQTVHAILYASFVSIALAISLNSIAGMIVAFILMNFLLKADKVFRKIFKMSSDGSLLDRVSKGAEEARFDKMVKSAQGAIAGAKPAMNMMKNSPAAGLIRGAKDSAIAGVVGAGAQIQHNRQVAKEKETAEAYKPYENEMKGVNTLTDKADKQMEQANAILARAKGEKNASKRQKLEKDALQRIKSAEKEYDRAAAQAQRAMEKLPFEDRVRAMLPDEKAAKGQELMAKERDALSKAMAAKAAGAGGKEQEKLFAEYRLAKKETARFNKYANQSTKKNSAFDYDKYFDENGKRKISYVYNPETGKVEKNGFRARAVKNFNVENLFGVNKDEQEAIKKSLAASTAGLVGLGSMFLGLGTIVSSPGIGMGLLAYGSGKFAGTLRPNRNIGKPSHRSNYANKYYTNMEFPASTVATMNNTILKQVESEVLKLEELKLNKGRKFTGTDAKKLRQLKKKREKMISTQSVIDQMYGNETVDTRSMFLRAPNSVIDKMNGPMGEALDELAEITNTKLLKEIADYQVEALQIEAKAREIDMYRSFEKLDALSAMEDKGVGAFQVSEDGTKRIVVGKLELTKEQVEIVQDAISKVKEERTDTRQGKTFNNEEKQKIAEKIKELAKDKDPSLVAIFMEASKSVEEKVEESNLPDKETKEAYLKEKERRRKAGNIEEPQISLGTTLDKLIVETMKELGVDRNNPQGLSISMKNKIKEIVKQKAGELSVNLFDEYKNSGTKLDIQVTEGIEFTAEQQLDMAMDKVVEQKIFNEIDRHINSEILSKVDGAVERAISVEEIKESRKKIDLNNTQQVIDEYILTEDEKAIIGEQVKKQIKDMKYTSIEQVDKGKVIEAYVATGQISEAEAKVQVDAFMGQLKEEKTFKGRVKDSFSQDLQQGSEGKVAKLATTDAKAEDGMKIRINIIEQMRSAVPPAPANSVTPEIVAEQNRVVENLLNQMSESYQMNTTVASQYGKKTGAPTDYKQYVKVQGSDSYQTAKTAKKTGRDTGKKLSMGDDPGVYGPLLGLEKILGNM